ncbi:MAG TPA: metallophosphoesterase [Bacillota bacterium]|nr:metallophosphoesterase [Bacillota bacterium]
MRIALVSDTHGQIQAVQQALATGDAIDLLLHAGDHYADGLKLGQNLRVNVKAVTGNCDLMVAGPEEEIFRARDRRILVTHGHQFRVKRTYHPLVRRAVELAVDVVVFGHTHLPTIFEEQGILFINPGSPTRSTAADRRRTFAILTLKPAPRAVIIPLEPQPRGEKPD